MSTPCTNCGTPLQWAAEQGAWYCPKEGTWAQLPSMPSRQKHMPAPMPPEYFKKKYGGKRTRNVAGACVAMIAATVVIAVVSSDSGFEDHEVQSTPASSLAESPELPAGMREAQETFGLLGGSAIAPILTDNITFVTPTPGVTWAEVAFPCYRAAIEMGDGGSVADPFYEASPMVKPAFEAAGISIERDIAAIGGWACSEGPCFYVAATLHEPKKIAEMLAMFVPNIEEPEPLHWAFEAPGADGPRNIHVRVLPIEWNGRRPKDAWSTQMARATHIIFLQGLFGGAEVDLQSALATGSEAANRVRDAEGVLADTRGRCVIGTVGATDFKPGFDLESSRFALGLPPATSDPIARMMETTRSLNLEIEFALSAAASEADVEGWMDESRAWVSGVAGPVRDQFAAQGEMVQLMFDAMEIIASQGLRHELEDKVLRLSWHTDRVKESSLVRIEATLQKLQAQADGS